MFHVERVTLPKCRSCRICEALQCSTWNVEIRNHREARRRGGLLITSLESACGTKTTRGAETRLAASPALSLELCWRAMSYSLFHAVTRWIRASGGSGDAFHLLTSRSLAREVSRRMIFPRVSFGES